jgi:hypothetical protein
MEVGKYGRTPGARNDLICALLVLADGVEESIGVPRLVLPRILRYPRGADAGGG